MSTSFESLLRTMATDGTGNLWTTDHDLRIVEYYGAALRMLSDGEAAGEVATSAAVGTTVEELFRAVQPAASIVAAHQRALEGETVPLAFDCRGRSYRGYVAPRQDGAAPPSGCVGFIQDVVRDEAGPVFASGVAQRFEALASLAPVGIYLTDTVGDCCYVNRRWCEMAGMQPEEARGKGWVHAIHPRDRAAVMDGWYRVAESEGNWHLEYRLQTSQGKVTWVLGRAAALRDPHGRVTGYLGTNLDITERKQLEEQVRGVLESAPDAMVLVNGDGRIVLANAQTVKTFGYQREELLDQRVDVLLPDRYQGSHPAQRAAYAATPGPRLLSQRPGLAGRRKDGSEFPAEVALTPIETEEGLLVVAAVRDVTHRVEMEQSLRSNLETQSAFTALLRVGLEPLSLEDYLGRALDILFSVPWIALESKGAIYLVEDEPQVLVMRAARGLPDHLTASCHRVPFGCCLCGRAAESRQLVFGSHSDPCHERQCHEMPPHGHYCVPIASPTTLLGVIDLYVNDSHEKKQAETDFLRTVASLLAGIIRRRQAESALRESEERFQLAVRGTDAGIWDWDLTTNRVYYSARWKQMLGYDEQEIKDDYREWERLLHRDDVERALRTIGDYLAGRTPDYELEHRLRHKDGTYRWILARGAAVRDEQGTVYRMVGSNLDITQRKRSEQMLREREGQLLAAQRIQEYILPRAAPAVAGFDMAGKLIPAEFAAGDYFDYVRLPDGTLGVVVGDVSGHGVGAALLMATISAHLRSYAEEHSNVEEILQHVNSFLCREVEDVHFVTFFFARLDPQSRTLHYINAGHPHGHVLSGSGALKAVLDRGTMPLAIMEDVTFELHGPIQLEAGDVVLLITDGFLEALSPADKPFGEARVLDLIRANQRRSASHIVTSLQQAVRDFTPRDAPQDDLTAVVIKVLGEAS